MEPETNLPISDKDQFLIDPKAGKIVTKQAKYPPYIIGGIVLVVFGMLVAILIFSLTQRSNNQPGDNNTKEQIGTPVNEVILEDANEGEDSQEKSAIDPVYYSVKCRLYKYHNAEATDITDQIKNYQWNGDCYSDTKVFNGNSLLELSYTKSGDTTGSTGVFYVDFEKMQANKVLELPSNAARAFAYDPSAKNLYVYEYIYGEKLTLSVRNSAGKTTKLADFDREILGRGTGHFDNLVMDLSPDKKKLLINDTYTSKAGNPTENAGSHNFIFDLSSKTITPYAGNFGRWISNDKFAYLNRSPFTGDQEGANLDSRLYYYDINTGQSTQLSDTELDLTDLNYVNGNLYATSIDVDRKVETSFLVDMDSKRLVNLGTDLSRGVLVDDKVVGLAILKCGEEDSGEVASCPEGPAAYKYRLVEINPVNNEQKHLIQIEELYVFDYGGS